jgi:type I restriction-modification system DNA methylase subunit
LGGRLVVDIERGRDDALAEIEAAYGPALVAQSPLRTEIARLQELIQREAPVEKEKKKAFREERRAAVERLKQLKRLLKPLEKLEEEAEHKRSAVREGAEAELALTRETASELMLLYSDPAEARRCFVVVERLEFEKNEFNLNVPRYVDTAPIDKLLNLEKVLADFQALTNKLDLRRQTLESIVSASMTRI